MYIEDIIDHVAGISRLFHQGPNFLSSFDEGLLSSFDSQITNGNSLTEKQQNLAVKILKKYRQEISDLLAKPVDTFLDAPTFKSPARLINQVKTVKIYKDTDTNQSMIGVSFPYDEKLVNDIKEYRKQTNKSRLSYLRQTINEDILWNKTKYTWDFQLREEHIDWLYSKLSPLGFTFDQDLLNFSQEIEKIKDNVETHVPMVVYDGKIFKFSNSHKNIPQPQSTDLLEVLFQAKKYGINIWDEHIDLALNDDSINSFTRTVLTSNFGPEKLIDPKFFEIDVLTDTINYVGNTVFVIPGGDEYEMLKKSHQFLNRMGIKNEQISVLFRLDGNNGKICNDYVKDNQLNNTIDEKIKIFFISTKVPKPLLKTSTSIDAIVNLGCTTVHYTLKNLLKNHHFVINYKTKKIVERYIF